MKTERELFLYELNGHGYHFKNTDWHDDWERFEDDQLNMVWEMWCASSSREGYKLVPVADINEFYQDDVESEIFCERESDFDSLGDCTELDEIMTVKKYTSARLKKETLYGVWCKCEKKAPYFKETEFKLFSNKDDARKAMIGASE